MGWTCPECQHENDDLIRCVCGFELDANDGIEVDAPTLSQDGDPAVEALTADRNPDQVTKKIGWLPYVLSGFSFIPAIGVFFGLIVIIVGIIERKIGGWKLVAIGSLGILVTLAPYTFFIEGILSVGASLMT